MCRVSISEMSVYLTSIHFLLSKNLPVLYDLKRNVHSKVTFQVFSAYFSIINIYSTAKQNDAVLSAENTRQRTEIITRMVGCMSVKSIR